MTRNIFYTRIMQKLAKIAPKFGMDGEDIAVIPEQESQQIVQTLIRHACQAKHIGNISAARNILAVLPCSWLTVRLPAAIEATLSRDDEWEFRRLIELLRSISPELLERYLAEGQRSSNAEVRETAGELGFLSRDAESKYFLFMLSGTRQHEQGLGLLPGLPQAFVRNRIAGLLRPGAIVEIACSDNIFREFTLETYRVSVPPCDLDDFEQKMLPLVPVIRCETPELLKIGGDVVMKIE